MNNILLCGVGGQGTVLASRILAQAAMTKDTGVMSAETIGMAQKGGSVFSHLRIGDDVKSPMIEKGTADIIMGFEPAETVRMLPYLKKGGWIAVNASPVIPTTETLKKKSYSGGEMIDYLKSVTDNIIVVDGIKACREVGSPKALNMIMLGAAIASGALDFTEDEVKAAIADRVKPQFVELNLKALEYGMNCL